MLTRRVRRVIIAILSLVVTILCTCVSAENELSHLQQRANAGDANSCYRLAVVYANGKGVPKDFDKASEFLYKAADLGHTAAKKALENPKLLLESAGSDSSRMTDQGTPGETIRKMKRLVRLIEKGSQDARDRMGELCRNERNSALIRVAAETATRMRSLP